MRKKAATTKPRTRRPRPRAPEAAALVLPTLIKCGTHLINPRDVSRISCVQVKRIADRDEDPGDDWTPNDVPIERRSMYIVRFVSDPNLQYPCWVEKKDIGALLAHFLIISEG